MTKTFQDLIQEVHEKGICQECGGCVSFCSSAEYGVIGFTTPNAPPNYLNKEKCLECGICYCICPQTRILDDDLNQTYKFTDFTQQPMGPFVEVLSCQATDEEFLRYGTDGGVVNSIINYLFEKKAIDGAVVAKTDAPFAREAMVAKNREDLIAASGVKLDYSQQLEKMDSSEERAEFNTYTIAIPKLNRYKFKKFAVVGTPCQIYTLRCMQQLGVTPRKIWKYAWGCFASRISNLTKMLATVWKKTLTSSLTILKKSTSKKT
ncbi:MAG TPA: coenzyme F420 hydrogenase/dehydrogenase beta subunit N-terminal domain-containing protein [Candidatus Lokiarchaeia archaeon]|nr:coenzyme F420 hydrogenase/dehydrogenase beta subunit N-terminal domain-containing protein [Candidatus Lokiarchaeia archaeon]